MQTFRQYLRELYDTQVRPVWTTDNPFDRQAAFEMDGDRYVVEFTTSSTGTPGQRPWVVSFYREDEDGQPNYMLTRDNKGNAVKVGGAILNIVANFMRQYKPASVEFAAEEPERIPLYRKIVPILATRTGYTPDTSSESPDIFRLLRP